MDDSDIVNDYNTDELSLMSIPRHSFAKLDRSIDDTMRTSFTLNQSIRDRLNSSLIATR